MSDLSGQEPETPEIEDTQEPAIPNEETLEDITEPEGPVIPSFESEEDEQEPDSNSTIRQMRDALKERDKEIKALRKFAPAETQLPPKPKLEDFDYDEEQHEEALEGWLTTKADMRRTANKAEEARQQQSQAWEQQKLTHDAGLQSLGFDDAMEMKETVGAALNDWQQEVLVKYTKNSPVMTYALGKNAAKLNGLAQITDVIEFGHAVKMLESKMKTERQAPAIDKVPAGQGNKLPSSNDKELAKLEKKARETGDRTELRKYRKQMAEKT